LLGVPVPRAALAGSIGCYSSDLSAYLNRGAQLSRPKIELLRAVVEALEICLPLFPIKPDLRDPENIRTLLTEAAKIIAARESEASAAASVELNRIVKQTREYAAQAEQGLAQFSK
jgi:ribosomal protein S18